MRSQLGSIMLLKKASVGVTPSVAHLVLHYSFCMFLPTEFISTQISRLYSDIKKPHIFYAQHCNWEIIDKKQTKKIITKASCILCLFNCAISFQKLRNKGQNDCASPDADDCFGHSPLMDDHFGKLSEDSDLMYKRCGVSTSFCLLLFCVDFLSLCWCSPQALNKKEHRGCDSPDPDASYVLTPHTEEKYKKINEEFDNMMRNHKIVSTVNATFLLGFVAQKDFFPFYLFNFLLLSS